MATGGYDASQEHASDIVEDDLKEKMCATCIKKCTLTDTSAITEIRISLLCGQCRDFVFRHQFNSHEIILVQKQDSTITGLDMKGLDKCMQHTKKVQFYCDDHDLLCCSGCVTTHRKCDKFSELNALPEQKDTYREVHTALLKMNEESISMKQEMTQLEVELNETVENLSSEFDEVKSKLLELLDNEKSLLIQQFESISAEKKLLIEQRKDELHIIETDISQGLHLLSKTLKIGTPSQQFIVSRAVSETLRKAQGVIECQKQNPLSITMHICFSNELTELLRTEQNNVGLHTDESCDFQGGCCPLSVDEQPYIKFRRVIRSETSDDEILIGSSNCIRSNEQLQNQLDVLEREKKETERKNELLTHTLENERQARMNEARLSKQTITKVKEDLTKVEAEKQDALTSAMMSTKVRDNNPNIADLSDQFRPTKLAEMFSELYDNEWTDAFTAVNSVLTERQTITFLLDILMDAYFFCYQELDNSWRMVCDWYLDDSLPNEQQLKKLLKDSRKVVVVRMTQRITERYKDNLVSVCNIQMLHAMLSTEVVEKYVLQSVKLCLLMCANDPPVVIDCPDRPSTGPANSIQHDAANIAIGKVEQSSGVISPKETQFFQETLERQQLGKGEFYKKDFVNNIEDTNNEEQLNTELEQFQTLQFDRNMFKEYTTRGPYLEFVVWPVIYLHQGGPMLGKGVAQGTRKAVCSGEEEQWTWKKVE